MPASRAQPLAVQRDGAGARRVARSPRWRRRWIFSPANHILARQSFSACRFPPPIPRPAWGPLRRSCEEECVRKLRIGIVDLVTKGPTRALYARIMHANLASIMPQVIGVWCEAEGHEVTQVCYTGFEDLVAELPTNVDLVFIGAFTEAALLAYALSNLFRSRGAITVLGGPHARCYPEDARRYFDYVLGFTDRAVIRDVLQDCARHRPLGVHRAAPRQPTALPGVRERWKFIEPTLRKAPFFKIVPMLGSLGCPYTCSFCIDSVVPYQPLDMQVLQDDLKFLRQQLRRPLRRGAGCDRGGGSPGLDRLRRGEQPLTALGAARQAAAT